MSTTQTASDVRLISISNLTLSQTDAQAERRKRFDKGAIAELADSLKTLGQLQPIVVRQIEGVEQFEIVAGERRFLAAKQAGLPEIQVSVRELTDEQVIEAQLVENLQRQDVHPMAEAEGYEQLRKLGRGAEDIGEKVGKSKAYVYARMKLLDLVKEARAAYYDDKLTASTALYIARIPSVLQKQALAEITKPRAHWGEDAAPMSARAAQKHIHDNYMLRLSDAGFKTEDAELVPAAGACGRCPKRTGNQAQLFGDVKGADVCTDPICFKQKIAAHAERVIAAAAESGQKVIAGKEAEKIAKHGTEDYSLRDAGFVRLDARDYESNGTYRKTLGKEFVPTLLQDPETGKLIEVARQTDVDKARGGKKTGADRENERQRTERRNAELKHRAAIAYRRGLAKAIFDASGKLKAFVREDYNQIATRMLERLDHECKKRLFDALGWTHAKKKYTTEFVPPTAIAKMQLEQLLQFIRMLSIAHELQVWQHSGETRPKDMEALAGTLGVDLKAVRSSSELKPVAKKKAPAKGK